MSKHLKRDLERIERLILEIGAMVELSIHKSIAALNARRLELAGDVIAGDEEIDRREVELEEDCLKALALHQPVAVDLRFIIAVIKVNSTLERMGDLACNIARGALHMDGIEWREFVQLDHMAELVRHMVRLSLDALVRLDVNQALEVLNQDDDVDTEKNAIFDTIVDLADREGVEYPDLIRILLVSRHLERVADHATNIAEDVVFLVEGDIIRHKAASIEQ
jgi:phosphate transport system protein